MTGSTEVEKIYDIIMIGDGVFRGSPQIFAKMRKALALAADIPVSPIRIISEEGDDIAIDAPDLSDFPLVEENIYGEWETPPGDPILYLLAHSDEKGEIKEDQMIPLAHRLMELEERAYDIMLERTDLGTAQLVSRLIQNFAKGLVASHETDRPVKFVLEPYYP
jgi:hypothetical protein